MKNISFAILAVLLMIFFSCGKEELGFNEVLLNDETEISMSDQAKFITLDDMAGLKSYDEGMLRFKKSAMQTEYTPGDVIMYDTGDSIEFILKVESIEDSGDDLLIQTTNVSIFDAFKSCSIPISFGNDIEFRSENCKPQKIGISSCEYEFCFKFLVDDDRTDLFFQKSEDGILFINFLLDAGFDYSLRFDCETFTLSEELDLIGGVFKKALKKKIKSKLIAALKKIKDKSELLSDENVDKVVDKILETIDLNLGFNLKELSVGGKFKLELTGGVSYSFDSGAQLVTNPNTSLPTEIIGFGSNPNHSDPEVKLGSDFEFKCSGVAEFGLFTGFVFKIPGITVDLPNLTGGTTPFVVLEEIKLLRTRIDFGVRFEGTPVSAPNGINLKVTAQNTLRIESSSDIGFIDAPVVQPSFTPQLLGSIPLCDDDLKVIHRYTNHDGIVPDTLYLRVESSKDSRYNLFFPGDTISNILRDYNKDYIVVPDIRINSFRVSDEAASICCSVASQVTQIGSVEETTSTPPMCSQNVKDGQGNLYCTLKVCENNFNASNCKVWIRKNLRYTGSGINAPYPRDNGNFWSRGRLYSWEEISNVSICPNNYRVATLDDYEHLFNAIRNNNNDQSLDMSDFNEYLNSRSDWSVGAQGNGDQIYSKFFQLLPNGYYSIWDNKFQDTQDGSYLWTMDPNENSQHAVKVLHSSGGGMSYVPFVKDAFRLGVRCVCDSGCD